VSELILGTDLGGSDGFSGITANPALGYASDRLVAAGGTVILAEVPELVGAEHLLAARASEPVAAKLYELIERVEARARAMHVDMRYGNPTQGNIAGGLTTIEEKSLGAAYKGGSSALREVVEYAERPAERGLVVMDTPGQDIEQMTGMVAGGAQIVVFTTGRGTPTGSPIAPVINPPLAGEGVWRGTGPLVRGAPPVLVTTFRPDPSYPQLVAAVAWIDSTRAWLQLYPGRYEPPGSGNAPAEVPPALRTHLLATFNSGFKLEDDAGGFVAMGHIYAPLKDGQATFIRYRDGTADIQTWTGGPNPGPNVEFARQNLPLIVAGGRLNPSLNDPSLWGATVGNAVRVWRSGAGIDAHGNLIYAAADIQTAQSLAKILKRAGAVRAMELDINYDWTTFNFYGTWDAGRPQKLLPGMGRPATRYLTPDDRDFFAVYARVNH